MKNEITNPFIISGYVSPDYFCDRQNETNRLLKAISSVRNVTLISLRRIGKTGLLKHVKYQLEQTRQPITVIYIDLMPTMNGNEFLNSLATALVNRQKKERGLPEKIIKALGSLRPKLTYDGLTGQPSVTLDVSSSAEIHFGFNQLLNVISEIKSKLVIMLDEFQQINRYPEENIEQMLRSIIQTFPTIPFIFSGSSKHMIEQMFLSAGRPFYQSSEIMYLDKISETDYKEFIVKMFSKGGKKIDDEAILEIFKWTRLHTFYVQFVCSLLFQINESFISRNIANKVFHQILTDFEHLFINYRNLIPPQQFRLLQAIAIEDGVSQPTSGAFIQDHDLTSASSVSTSLKALEDKEMIVQENEKWVIYDVFFSRWLGYHYHK